MNAGLILLGLQMVIAGLVIIRLWAEREEVWFNYGMLEQGFVFLNALALFTVGFVLIFGGFIT